MHAYAGDVNATCALDRQGTQPPGLGWKRRSCLHAGVPSWVRLQPTLRACARAQRGLSAGLARARGLGAGLRACWVQRELAPGFLVYHWRGHLANKFRTTSKPVTSVARIKGMWHTYVVKRLCKHVHLHVLYKHIQTFVPGHMYLHKRTF